MGTYLAWPPVVWTGRILLVVFGMGIGYLFLLYLARFLRPKNAWELVTSDLPTFTRVSGTAKVLGQEVKLEAETGEQLKDVNQRLEALEQKVQEVVHASDLLTSAFLSFGRRNGYD